jgi:hypothetical protein
MHGKLMLVLFVLTSTALLAGCTDSDCKEKTKKSYFEYHVCIDSVEVVGVQSIPKEPIYNVTFYLPFPVLNGSALGIENVSKPDNWQIKIIDTRSA